MFKDFKCSIFVGLCLMFISCVKSNDENQLLRPGFIATFPASVLPNSTVKFCIRFQNIFQDISINVQDDFPNCFDELNLNIYPSNPDMCLDIKINSFIKEYKVKELTIKGESIDGTYKFNDTKKFVLKTDSYITLIETDKPAYKPKDKVQIRVLALDHVLRPLKIKYDLIYITDSSNSRVSQWNDVITKNGLISLELPLSDEPNLGIWSIETIRENEKIPSYKASFEVKKYVLPKFEVTIDHKSSIKPKDKNLSVNVCAKYSHGNKVSGNFTLTAYTKKFSYQTFEQVVSKTLSQTNQGKGCSHFLIDLKALGFETNSYINMVYFNASVIESDTNIKANSTSSINFAYRSIDIKLIEPQYYKPGLPIKFKLMAKPEDDEEDNDEKFKNKEIQLIFEIDSVAFFKKNMSLDSNYLIEFLYNHDEDCQYFCDLLTDHDTPRAFNFKIIIDYKEIESPIVYHHSFTNGIQRNFYIEPWYSPNYGYLQIYKQNHHVLKCNEELNANIILASPYSNYGNLMFQVQAGSKIVLSGSYNKNQTILDDFDKTLLSISHKNQKVKQIKVTKKNNNHTFELIKEIYEDSYELNLKVISTMSPEFKLFLFYINDREIVADLASFKTQKCLKNNVDLSLSTYVTQVGKRVEINIETNPNSICALSSIDKSVSFIGKRNSINYETLFQSLAQFDSVYDHENSYTSTENKCKKDKPELMPIPRPRPIPIRTPLEKIAKRSFMPHYFRRSSIYDATKAFRDSRLIYLTDYGIYQECNQYYPIYFSMPRSNFNNMRFESMRTNIEPMGMMADANLKSSASFNSLSQSEVTVIETVREFFPETWLWNINIADENGKVNLKEKAPDTITDWIFDSYCLSNEIGIGISDSKTLKVFQPLFISMDLPYSVVKGEIFKVKASVFNYDSTCIPVQMDINTDRKLYIKKSSFKTAKFCICPDKKVTQEFSLEAIDFDMENGLNITIKARSINQSNICDSELVTKNIKFFDSETRSVRVEPEGIPKEETKSIFAVFKTSQKLTNQKLEFDFPKNLVPKSARVSLKVTGDLTGPVLNNLDDLVRQPTGCGEQNMVNFAPIISVLEYLKKTFQLTDQLNSKTQDYLKIGYQRQLTYRHDDGSFSAFGPKFSKDSGGTWLTAFVLRCFSDALKLNQIKIDENDVKKSMNKLFSIQNEDGSFDQVGVRLLSKGLSGGLKEENGKIGLTAYVLISLIKAVDALDLKESGEYEKKLIEKGLSYLQNSTQSVKSLDTYSIAIVLYTFKLANLKDKSIIEDLIFELDSRATKENDFIYWRENKNVSKNDFFNPSADLELTSYVLLSTLIDQNDDDLESIVPIVRWINSQRNSLGGFYSTQDTVMALDALSKFSSAFYSKFVNLDVKFGQNKKTVTINPKNRLLLQNFKMENLKENQTNTMNIDIEGYGTGLVQLVMKYSVFDDEKLKAKNNFQFSILPSKSIDCKNAKLKILAKYVGEDKESSMVIVSLKLQSGWLPVEETIVDLIEKSELKRYEINENRIFLYFDKLDKIEKEFEISIFKKFDIKNSRPGHISVFDYYDSLDDSVTQQFEVEEQC